MFTTALHAASLVGDMVHDAAIEGGAVDGGGERGFLGDLPWTTAPPNKRVERNGTVASLWAPGSWASSGRWCMETTDGTVPGPHGSAADGNGLGFAGHAVERLDGEGDLAKLGGPAADAQLGPDQVLVAAWLCYRTLAQSC